MYRAKFFLILVLGSLVHMTISLNRFCMNVHSNNKRLKSNKDQSDLIYGKSVSEVEKSIKNFILTMSYPLNKNLLRDLRKTSLGNDLKKSISISTRIVAENLQGIRKDLGISKYKNSNEPVILIPDKNDALENNLIHSGLVILSEIIDLGSTGINKGSEFLFENETTKKLFESNWNKPRYMDFITFTDELFIYIDCMIEDSSNEDIKKAVRFGSSHSINEIINYLKKNLKKPSSRRNSNTAQRICSSVENIKSGGYKKCIDDWENINNCFQSRNLSKRHEFSKMMKNIFPRRWIRNVRDLNPSCKLKKDQIFECKFREKQLKSTKNQMKYMIEIGTGKKLKNKSSLAKVVDRFSRMISKSPMAKSLVQSCSEYVAISQNGKKRLQLLKKMSKGNPRLLRELKKVSRSLNNYKNGLVEDSLNAIVEFNQIPIYLEKSLVRASPKIEGWPFLTSILACLSGLINSLFGPERKTLNFKTHTDVNYNKINKGLVVIQEEFPDLKPRISAEKALDNLLRTMNQVSSQNRNLTGRSIYSGGITNVLLVLMFLETLSAVTLLISQNLLITQNCDQGIPKSDENLDNNSASVGSPEVDDENNGNNGNNGTNGNNGVKGDEDEINEDKTEEDYKFTMTRKKRFSDLDSNTDFPDSSKFPLNDSKYFFNYTINPNNSNITHNFFYDIRESVLIGFENIEISQIKSPEIEEIETSQENYPYYRKFNDTIRMNVTKNL